jgi:hypothetical protein
MFRERNTLLEYAIAKAESGIMFLTLLLLALHHPASQARGGIERSATSLAFGLLPLLHLQQMMYEFRNKQQEEAQATTKLFVR